MNIFDAVKDELSTRDVVESYGIHVRHNGMCCCPFHGDKNPSMIVDKKHFHCFGCGESGDVIQFVAKYFDLSRYEAAKKLSEDFGVSYDKWKPEKDENGKTVKPKPRPKSPEQIYRETEHHFFMVLSDYYHVLKGWKQSLKPKTMDEDWDDRFAEALDKIPYLEMVMDEFLASSKEERKEMFSAYKGTIDKFEARLAEIREMQPISVLQRIRDSLPAEPSATAVRPAACL